MKKRGSLQAAVALAIIFIIIFSYLTYFYLESVKEYQAEPEEYKERTVIEASKETMLFVISRAKRYLGFKIKSTARDVSDEFNKGIANLTGDFSPGDCKLDSKFDCLEVRVDWRENRLWFFVENNIGGDIVLERARATGSVSCNSVLVDKRMSRYDRVSFTLLNCTLGTEPSTIELTYFPIISGPDLGRMSKGTFRLEEPSET